MTLALTPNTFAMTSAETLALSFNATAWLGSGETIASATAVLTDLGTGTTRPASLSGSPSVSGAVVIQAVTDLAAGRYRLEILITTSAGNVEDLPLIITCPF
jgi:hypothetical protein